MTLPPAFLGAYPFGLDDYQVRACEVLDQGRGVLVAAPTGAGKTVVGEYAVFKALSDGEKCFYTTPIKALSNQKFRDLAARHGAGNVGLLTGDTVINSEAPIVVMTTEVLRNMLYARSRTLSGLGYVVMDEVHYLSDRFRGPVWEEVIIGLPDSVRLVGLSATVSNAEEFGEWLDEVRGGVDVVVSERRPVPLFQHVMAGNRLYDLFEGDAPTARELPGGNADRVNPELVRLAKAEAREFRDDARNPRGRSGKGKKNMSYGRYGGGASSHRSDGAKRPQRLTPSRATVVRVLDHAGLLPAIVFVFSRQGCEAAVRQLSGQRLTSHREANALRELALSRVADMSAADLRALRFDEFLDSLTRGFAAHHAGLLPVFKTIVEEGFSKGWIKVVFATETLALGINMPARTVVIEKLVKYNGESHVDVTPGEYTQLTGRAGRRGIDTEGHAVVWWQPGMDPRAVAGLASRRTYPLRSAFTPTYNMAVNLVRTVGRERARGLLGQSFAQFQTDRVIVSKTRSIVKDREAIAGYLEAATCDRGDFAEYARLRERISQLEAEQAKARKTLQRAQSGSRKQRAKAARPDVDPQIAAEITRLRRELQAHPCHACPDRESHARFAERAMRLERESSALQRKSEARSNSIAVKFDRICGVLASLGYLTDEGDAVTEAGAMLANVYCELDLVVTESLRQGVFDGLDAPQLAAVLSCVVFESRLRERRPPRMPDDASEAAMSELRRVWHGVSLVERDFRLERAPEPDIGFAQAAFWWCRGDDMGVILDRTELTAGDFVRWCRQVIDLAGQLARAVEDEGLRRELRAVVDGMRRGVVDFDPDR